MEEGSPSVTYDNGYQVNSAAEVKRALDQCIEGTLVSGIHVLRVNC
ncbi:hypothetical protein ACWC9R_05555 [Streptomyces sp. NPDC001219]